ncbi:MAG: hypothetical protein JXA23_05970 [Bacteroidales bacterium]|nr:hypothetical protein [Bacteroidales bacterium]
MKKHGKIIVLLAIALIGFSGCGSNNLDQDVAPIADAMCKFIEIQNNLKTAIETNDTMNIQKYSADKHKMTVEITILNNEFQEKYGDLVKDKEFGKKFKKSMNKAMIDCPALSTEDREKMKAELNE